MIYLNAVVSDIDYDVLLGRIEAAAKNSTGKQENRPGFPMEIVSNLGWLANLLAQMVPDFVFAKIIDTRKKALTDLAKDYGVHLSFLTADSQPVKMMNKGERYMLNISVSIKNIDYKTLLNAIEPNSQKTGKSNNKGNVVGEVIRIVKPFIADTLSTIPPSAIAELFDLLARDKAVDLAKKYGVQLSDIDIKPD